MKIGAHGQDYSVEPASDGKHDCVLAEVADLGWENTKYGDRHQGVLVFQVAETFEVEFDGVKEVRRKEVRQYFDAERGLGAPKVKSKGTQLRRLLEGWRGKPFTQDELTRFAPESKGGGGELLDLDSLVGKPGQLMVSVEEAKTSDRQYAKLIKMLPPNKETAIELTDQYPYKPLAERGNDDGESRSSSAPSSSPEDDDGVPWDLGIT